MEIDDELDDVNPELTRELLISALKILSKDRRLGPPKLKPSKLIMEVSPKPVPVQEIPKIIPLGPVKPPCNKIPELRDEMADEIQADEPVSGNGRRAIGLARNPYTGQLHYAYYPVVRYPMYG